MSQEIPLAKPPGYKDPVVAQPQPQLQPPPPFPPRPLPHRFKPPPPPPPRKRRSCCRVFCCCICITLLLLIIIFLSVSGFFYLWFEPKLPEIHLESVQLTKFNLTGDPDAPTLDVLSRVVFQFRNPNKELSVVFSRRVVSLNAGENGDDISLGQVSVQGLVQGKNNVTTLKLSVKENQDVVEKSEGEKMKSEVKGKGLVVKVEMRTGIGFKGKKWSAGSFPVRVTCPVVVVKVVKDGGGGGGAAVKCRFGMINWINMN